MSVEIIGLLITFLLGLFILIGALVAFLANKKQKITDFSLGLAFSVIIMLIILDLIPEIIEHLGMSYIWLFLIFVILGYGLLRLLDHFVPDHHDGTHMTKKESNDNLAHIGLISSIALVIHNIVEATTFYQGNQPRKKGALVLSCVTLSTLLGGFLSFILNNKNLPDNIIGSLLSLTLGMLLFILFSELLPRVRKSKYHVERNTGIVLGIIIMLLSLCI